MTEGEKEELYDFLVQACQNAGFCAEYTYDLLHEVVDSIDSVSPEELT